jgi:hypothetical protein
MRGHDVAAWQTSLGAKIDGFFGPDTEALTRLFQQQNGLTPVDGVVGAATRGALSAALFDSETTQEEVPALGLPFIRFVQAKVWRWMDRKTCDWIVLHSAEVREKPSSAEAVAAYFQNPDPLRPASAHFAVDCDSIVQCVRTEHSAAHCGKGNGHSIGIEQAGYARQSRDEWLDDYGRQMLGLVAKLVAREAHVWKIPLVKLTSADIIAGRRGICGHVDINGAFPNKGGHTDPGTAYPWDVLLELAKREV